MKLLARLVMVCTCVALAAPSFLQAAQDKEPPESFLYELKYKKGDKVRYKVVGEATFTAQLPSLLPQPLEGSIEKTVIYLEQVKDIDSAGAVTLVAQYEEYMATQPLFWIKGGGASEGGQALSFSKEEMPKIEYAIDKYGKPVKPFQLPENLRQGLQMYMEAEANMSSMRLSPGRPVTVGESWDIKYTDDIEGIEGLQVVTHCRLTKFEDLAEERCAILNVKTEYSGKFAATDIVGMAGSVKSVTEGTVWVRASDCRIVKANLFEDYSLDAEFTQPVATASAGVFINKGDRLRISGSGNDELVLIRSAGDKGK
jgi:hypothetical protein